MRIVLMLAVVLASACAPPAPKADTGPAAVMIYEVDVDKLQTGLLKKLSDEIREELRQKPMIALNPIGGRKVEGDYVVITPARALDIPAAIVRIQNLGHKSQAARFTAKQAGEAIEVLPTHATLQAASAGVLKESVDPVKRRLPPEARNGKVEVEDGRLVIRVPGLLDLSKLAPLELTLRPTATSINLVDVDRDYTEYEPGVERDGRIALKDNSSGQWLVIDTDPIVEGNEISGASQAYDQNNRPSISFQLNEEGTRKFAVATTDNIGRPFAIVVDGEIISAPNIHTPITNGSGQIAGAFTIEEAERIAIVMRAGGLPPLLKLVSKRVEAGAPGK